MSRPPPLPNSAARTRAKALVGRTLSDRYRIDDVIAVGGMGAVYLAEHVHMQKRVAVKVLRPETQGFPELVARFEREAIAGAHLDHPNVASATDFGRFDDGSYFLVLEYVPGSTLHAIVKRGRVPAPRAARIGRQIAAGLAACHAMGVIHRDVKPRNVMVDEDRSDLVKLIDFGFARVPMQRETKPPAPEEQEEGLTRRQITLRGVVFGTVAYMAPETSLGMEAVDARSDLYALGVMLYEMLAGRHPFDGRDDAELFFHQRTSIPPPIAERVPGADVPVPLESIVRRLLAKRPAERFQTASEVVDALDRVILGSNPEVEVTPIVGSHSLSIQSALSRTADLPAARPSAPESDDDGAAMLRARLRARRRSLFAGAVLALGGAALAALTMARSEPRPSTLSADPRLGAATERSGAVAAAALHAIRVDEARKRFRDAREAKDSSRQAEALVALASADPTAFGEAEIAWPSASLAVRMAFENDPRTREVFEALATQAGSQGIDVLYEIAAARGGSRGAKLANEQLARPEVRARATAELRATLDLRDASCGAKKTLFERAAAEGDIRTWRLLERLRSSSACQGNGQCCYWANKPLEVAIDALEKKIGKRD